MLAFVLFLIVIWLILAIIGIVIHGLFYLVIIAVVLLIATVLFAGTRLRSGRR